VPVVERERGVGRPGVGFRREGRRGSGGMMPSVWRAWICLSSLRIWRSSLGC
jgi:hypothetical protein